MCAAISLLAASMACGEARPARRVEQPRRAAKKDDKAVIEEACKAAKRAIEGRSFVGWRSLRPHLRKRLGK